MKSKHIYSIRKNKIVQYIISISIAVLLTSCQATTSQPFQPQSVQHNPQPTITASIPKWYEVDNVKEIMSNSDYEKGKSKYGRRSDYLASINCYNEALTNFVPLSVQLSGLKYGSEKGDKNWMLPYGSIMDLGRNLEESITTIEKKTNSACGKELRDYLKYQLRSFQETVEAIELAKIQEIEAKAQIINSLQDLNSKGYRTIYKDTNIIAKLADVYHAKKPDSDKYMLYSEIVAPYPHLVVEIDVEFINQTKICYPVNYRFISYGDDNPKPGFSAPSLAINFNDNFLNSYKIIQVSPKYLGQHYGDKGYHPGSTEKFIYRFNGILLKSAKSIKITLPNQCVGNVDTLVFTAPANSVR